MSSKLMLEEQETFVRYDVIDKMWYADTTYPPHMRKFEKKGWECTNTSYYEDGTVQGKSFCSGSKKGVTISNPTTTRNMTEEQKEAARQRFLQYHANKENATDIDEEDDEDENED